MPLRSLTPLGKQLRLVLAAIRTTPSDICPSIRPSPSKENPAVSNHGWRLRRSCTAAATIESQPSATEHAPKETKTEVNVDPQRHWSGDRFKGGPRISRISEPPRTVAHFHLTTPQRGKINHSYWNPRKRGARGRRWANAQRYRKDPAATHTAAAGASVPENVASCVHRYSNVLEPSQGEDLESFGLSEVESDLLRARGYSPDDVKAWAAIITSPGPSTATQAVAARISPYSPRSVPLSVLLCVLRRPYINARALRVLIEQAHLIIADHITQIATKTTTTDTVFLVFVRLLRHAREVWPRALESITQLLLSFLPDTIAKDGKYSAAGLQTLTYMLNKAMRLIALPTALEPFENNRFQMAALIRLLDFMAQHRPPIQTNREGYRAVILLQLRQHKSHKERQWADLKALSWPPWKQERTAMDFDITADDHGISKAGETLLQMRNAGYAPHEWEKVAWIYAGWDTDDTPTIQTLALFGTGGSSLRTGAAAWVARIATTRTVQEAWACYLAYEDSKLPPSQDVYLAIFQKLQKGEELRRRSSASRSAPVRQGSSAGNKREVEPLPPSSHLYTYTRSPPPTMDGLYRKLHGQGIVFQDRCLAFLIVNARSVGTAFEYISNSVSTHPQLWGLIHPAPDQDLTGLPKSLFTAFIELLSRFSNVPIHNSLHLMAPALYHDQKQINTNHSIGRAIHLLSHHRPQHQAPWNAVFGALAREATFRNMHSVFSNDSTRLLATAGTEEIHALGALLAHSLARKLLGMMEDCQLDLDVQGFHRFCWIVENMAIARWKSCLHSWDTGRAQDLWQHGQEGVATPSSGDAQHLRNLFNELVGEGGPERETGARPRNVQSILQLPEHLEFPSLSVLHACIRALGWLADYEGMLNAVRWMVKNQEELGRHGAIHRKDEVAMRKILTAVRVFLERSWLPVQIASPDSRDPEDPSRKANPSQGLKRLEQAASVELLGEARMLVDSVEEWGGWPGDEEVEEYCQKERFEQFSRIYSE